MMSVATLPRKEISWSSRLIARLRGSRTIVEFATTIGVDPEIVSLWESGELEPDAFQANLLSDLAGREEFPRDWKLEGSGVLLGDLETASADLADDLRQILAQRIQRLAE
ncbi:MAG: hypothetical protein ACREEM_02455 [Blastocatellia bacterium]